MYFRKVYTEAGVEKLKEFENDIPGKLGETWLETGEILSENRRIFIYSIGKLGNNNPHIHAWAKYIK